ncbi:MAG: tetratricopeptide repeat protein [Candidatus Saliniplasma sp.]
MRSEEKGYKKDVIVGREDELNQLVFLLDDLENDKGNTIFISGEEGVGKTTLVEEVKRTVAEKNIKILEGNCIYGVSKPYLPFKQAWKNFENGSLPSIKQREDGRLLEIESEDMLRGQRQAAFYETMKELKKASEKVPHVVIIEDLHWAGQSTLNLFHYLADRLENEPVLFIGTYNPGDAVPGDPFLEMKYLMSRKSLYDEIKLQPLDIEDTKELIKKIIGVEDIPNDFLETLFQHTGGNPLMINEGLHQMIETDLISSKENRFHNIDEKFSIPDSLKTVIERRVFRLEDGARETLQLGSVIGENIPFELLSNASGLEELEILDHIDSLAKNRLWAEELEDDHMHFSHTKIRDIVYDGIGDWVEKQKLHRDVAEAIHDVYQGNIQDKSLSLAEHYEEGEDHSNAVKYYLKAASRAEEVYAFEDALEIYERVKQLVDQLPQSKKKRSKILKKMAQAYRVIGEYNRSKKLLYNTLNHVSDFKEEQMIYIQIIKTLQSHGKYEEALDLIEERLSLEEDETLERGELLSRKGWSLSKMGRFDEAEEVFEKELTLAKGLKNDEFTAQAHHDFGSFYMMNHDFERGLTYLETARDIREELEDLRALANTLNSISGYHVMRGKLSDAVQELQNCLNLYDAMDDKLHMSSVHNNIGLAYRKMGELDMAMKHFTKAYDFSEQLGHKFKKGTRAMNLGLIHLIKGDLKNAERRFKEGKQLAEDTKNFDTRIESVFYLGKTELEKGDMEKAQRYLDKLIETISEREFEKDKGLVENLKGSIYREKGKLEESMESYSAAIKTFDDTNALDRKAITLYESGIVLKKKGDQQKANERLKTALEYFEKRKMNLWAERCRKEIT